MRVRDPSRSHPVAFRLEQEDLRALTSAAERHGMSPGRLARQLVLDALTNGTTAHLVDTTERIAGRLTRLDQKLGTFAYAILTEVAKLDADHVREWVRETFLEDRQER